MPVIEDHIPTTVEARLREIVEEVIADSDAYLVELVVRGRTGSRVVEVYLDGDAGVGVDFLARVSREAGFLIESEDLIKGKYNLNVSSPGADRPLLLLRQYPKHVGRTFKIRQAGGEEVSGELTQVNDDTIVLNVSGESREIPFDSIEEGIVELPW